VGCWRAGLYRYIIPAVDGNPDDKTLNELIPLLEPLANPQVLDVREELKK